MTAKTNNGNKPRNKHKHIALMMAVLLMAALMAGCAAPDNAPADTDIPQAQDEAPQPSADDRRVGTGGTEVIVDITGGSGETIRWHVMTDKSIVGDALLEHDLIQGEETDFGLMVTYVNGERADFNEDGAYWAFYIDGEFASVGVDATEIEQGKVYAFVYTEA